MQPSTTEALIALNLIEHVGPVRARLLLEHFGEAPRILQASKSELLRVRNIGEETAGAIAHWEKTIDLDGELKRIQDFGCHVLIQSDGDYPESLRQIYDPPLVLYVKGSLTAKDKNAVAMVGSRMTTHYGLETARNAKSEPKVRLGRNGKYFLKFLVCRIRPDSKYAYSARGKATGVRVKNPSKRRLATLPRRASTIGYSWGKSILVIC